MTIPWVRVADVLAGRHDGTEVEVRGWVWRVRSSGKIVFAVLRDSTGVLQCTVKKGAVAEPDFAGATQAAVEASAIVRGNVAKDERAPGGHELKATGFTLVGPSHDFPIYESTVEAESEDVLLDRRHLWLRSRRMTAMMKVKAKTLAAFRSWFDENAFWETTPSVITTNACEGGTTLFKFDYFGKEAYLSQSAQFYLEALIFSLDKVWCLTPSFRAEPSRTRKHLTEFGHLEEEAAWVDYKGNMEIQERLVSHVARRVAETAETELVELGREPADLKKVTTPFPRLTYDETIDTLRKKDYDRGRDTKGRPRGRIEWGEDLGAPDERALAEGQDKPVFVMEWPADIKAFYMKRIDEATVGCADLIAPEGYGEIIGGSERELDLESMKSRLAAQMERDGMPVDMAPYEWYFDLRRYGSVPHSGFGLGTERVVAWLTKSEHIRDTTPFPRTINRAYP
ncbi:MAG TPA: asparagine--tRNA ligase [Candidatus Thermoplasmatota archaeon]|nr:asparagine--tRNA ligase [Candidatus Thermoplasmatota archaeon]